MTVKFEFCSDLHDDIWLSYEHRFYQRRLAELDISEHHKLTPPGNTTIDWAKQKQDDTRVLVIAGDISNDIMSTVKIIKNAAEVYEYVVFVDGNHDHYDASNTIKEGEQHYRDELSDYPNVIYLDGKTHFTIDGTRFVGALGWYDWRGFEEVHGITQEVAKAAWLQGSNDSEYPQYDEFKDPATLAFIHAEAVRQQVADAQDDDEVESIVVVTHTAPRHELLLWKEGDSVWNNLSPSYMNGQMKSSLEADTKKKIKAWIYGHTHLRAMKDIDGVAYANNARGYPGESSPWWLPQAEV